MNRKINKHVEFDSVVFNKFYNLTQESVEKIVSTKQAHLLKCIERYPKEK